MLHCAPLRPAKKKRKIFLGALVPAVLLSFSSVRAAEPVKVPEARAELVQEGVDEFTDPALIIRYEKICGNSAFELFADMKTGHFAVKDLRSGRMWYSTPNNSQLDEKTKGKNRMAVRSQILVEYVYRADEVLTISPEIQNSQSSCVANGTVQVNRLPDGIRVRYYFDDIGCMIPVEYTLRDEYMEASIDVKGIIEGKLSLITSVHLLPYFGAGDWDDEGYLFVPDGSGAIIRFNNNIVQANPYSAHVFGGERTEYVVKKTVGTQNATMPVFGVVHKDGALAGIIAAGEGAASVVAANGNKTYGYNGVGSKLNYRTLSKMKIFENDPKNYRELYRVSRVRYAGDAYTVRYYSLPAAQADYVGIAQTYREYLIREKGLEKFSGAPAFNLDLYGAYDHKAAFLGIPYTKISPLTTFRQAQEILEALKAKGIGAVSVRYIGGENYGIFNRKIPVKAAPLPKLGGQKGFSALRKYAAQNDMSLFLDVDFVRYRTGGNGFGKTGSAVKSAFGETSAQNEYSRSVYTAVHNLEPYYLLKPGKILTAAQKYIKSYAKLGLASLGIASAGNILTSDLDPKAGLYRDGAAGSFESLYRELESHKIGLVFDGANAYAFPYARKILNAPTFSSGYDLFDSDVPFYQIVLHGYVPLSTAPMMQSVEPQLNFLKAVETGSELLYAGIYGTASVLTDSRYHWLYSSTYSLWADDAASKQREYAAFLKKVCNSGIVSHGEVSGNVYKTVFENGAGVLVNYGDEAAQVGDITVPPLSFTEITE